MPDIRGFIGEYRWLSNFWPAIVVLDNEQYASVEHAYQAAKSINPTVRALIRSAATPGKAKRLGKSVELRPGWNGIKIDIMNNLVGQKFFGSFELEQKLLATGDAYLEETNHWNDTFWGVCNGVGENHLGKILMKVRAELKDARKTEAKDVRGPARA